MATHATRERSERRAVAAQGRISNEEYADAGDWVGSSRDGRKPGMNAQKFGYLVSSAVGSVTRRPVCPNCTSASSAVVDRKYLVTTLRRCGDCLMMFRAPTDRPGRNERFYNSGYAQGLTTSMPSADDLAALKASGFAGEKDSASYIATLRALGVRPGASVFDFGCSWGYGSYQLAKAGFDVTAFEISSSRARYAAEMLGVSTVPNFETWSQGPRDLDVFFSAHVLEHVPAPSKVFEVASRRLRAGGLFVGFFPNGSRARRNLDPNWSSQWGLVHPNYLDEVFLGRAFAGRPHLFATGHPSGVAPIRAGVTVADDLTGGEMLFAARF